MNGFMVFLVILLFILLAFGFGVYAGETSAKDKMLSQQQKEKDVKMWADFIAKIGEKK